MSMVKGTVDQLVEIILDAGDKAEDVYEEVSLGIDDFKSGVGHLQNAGAIIVGKGPFAAAAPVALTAAEKAKAQELASHLESTGKRMKGPMLDLILKAFTFIKTNPELWAILLKFLMAKKA